MTAPRPTVTKAELNTAKLRQLRSVWNRVQVSTDLVDYYRACIQLARFVSNEGVAVAYVAGRLEVSKRNIDYCLDISRELKLADVRRYQSIRSQRGKQLSRTHLRQLAGLASSARESLLSEWTKKYLSTREFDQRAKSLKKARQRKSSGRPRRCCRKDLIALHRTASTTASALDRLVASDLSALNRDDHLYLSTLRRKLDELRRSCNRCRTLLRNRKTKVRSG